MTKLNNDGFEPGQVLTFEQIMNAKRAAPKASAVPSRDEIATMAKADVREWLEAHGAEVPKGASVADMRSALAAAIYIEDSADAV